MEKKLRIILLFFVLSFIVLPAAAENQVEFDYSNAVVVPGFGGERKPIWPSVSNQTETGSSEKESPSQNSELSEIMSVMPSAGQGKNNNTEGAFSSQTAILEDNAAAEKEPEEEFFWSNFNDDPVYSGPDSYIKKSIKKDGGPALLTKIRTYHYNGGYGAVPGTITLYDDGTAIGTWQAVGRSAKGIPNAYWEVLVDVLMLPGHYYYVKVSDNSSWSYNAASDDCGMVAYYGIYPLPADYKPSSQTINGTSAGTGNVPSSSQSGYKVTYNGTNCLSVVPNDTRSYTTGSTVTVLFDPVEYMQGTIFNGWDWNDDGVADFGYYYNTFTMPAKNVELKAVCYSQGITNTNNNFGVTTGEVDPLYQDNINGIYDPNTGWWYDPSFYYGVG